MATIKSYTDLEQSKKLTEIIPLDSADMYYEEVCNLPEVIVGNYILHNQCMEDKDYKRLSNPVLSPAWSLAALLDVMPKDKSIECSISFGYYNGKGEYIEKWLCAFEKEGETTDDYIIETFDGNNLVDACVAMIEKLHELKML